MGRDSKKETLNTEKRPSRKTKQERGRVWSGTRLPRLKSSWSGKGKSRKTSKLLGLCIGKQVNI